MFYLSCFIYTILAIIERHKARKERQNEANNNLADNGHESIQNNRTSPSYEDVVKDAKSGDSTVLKRTWQSTTSASVKPSIRVGSFENVSGSGEIETQKSSDKAVDFEYQEKFNDSFKNKKDHQKDAALRKKASVSHDSASLKDDFIQNCKTMRERIYPRIF